MSKVLENEITFFYKWSVLLILKYNILGQLNVKVIDNIVCCLSFLDPSSRPRQSTLLGHLNLPHNKIS